MASRDESNCGTATGTPQKKSKQKYKHRELELINKQLKNIPFDKKLRKSGGSEGTRTLDLSRDRRSL